MMDTTQDVQDAELFALVSPEEREELAALREAAGLARYPPGFEVDKEGVGGLVVSESMAELLARASPSPAEGGKKTLTVSMVHARCVEARTLADGDAEVIAGQAFKSTTLCLDRLGVTDIDNLELYNEVRTLYLQHNRIAVIENLEFMRELRVLALFDNEITRVQGLSMLTQLEVLDLSQNRIEQVTDEELDALPKSLVSLNLAGNPVAAQDGYRERVLAALPNLVQLDGEPV